MEHTPGPWKARGSDGKYLSSDWSAQHEEAASSSAVAVLAGEMPVALVVHHSMHHYGGAQAERIINANSRLIAAAPDMLAALRMTVDESVPAEKAMAWVEAAIAKATGEAT